jgi:glycosyltransferase involved in cell wall biosynthesis
MNSAPGIGLVISTFNQPEYLARVLNAVARGTTRPQELLLADDGSAEETGHVFRKWAAGQPFVCQHVWQEHAGFRKSRILNLAIAAAAAEYLVFLDGDCIPHPRFVADHADLCAPATFVQGHRALIERNGAGAFGLGPFAQDRRRALLKFQLRGLKHAYRWPRPLKQVRHDLRGARGCNLAVWRADLVAINGYNEAFSGWGREDSEMILRLMNSGVRRLDVRGWALCYHLWHPPASRSGLAANDELLAQARQQAATRCEHGLNQHLA